MDQSVLLGVTIPPDLRPVGRPAALLMGVWLSVPQGRKSVRFGDFQFCDQAKAVIVVSPGEPSLCVCVCVCVCTLCVYTVCV